MTRLHSIQVAQATRLQIDGRAVLTAIRKTPVAGPVAVGRMGLAGDEQADLSVHGGLDKAVYAYPTAHYPFWQAARARAQAAPAEQVLPWGSLGENLSLDGVLEADVWMGDVFRFAHCELRVSVPREPCYKLNAALGYNGAVRDMAKNGCCGWYLAVDEPGTLTPGESFELRPGPRRLRLLDAFNAKLFKHLR